MIFEFKKKPQPKEDDYRVIQRFVFFRRIDPETIAVLQKVWVLERYIQYTRFSGWGDRCFEQVSYWDEICAGLKLVEFRKKCKQMTKKYIEIVM